MIRHVVWWTLKEHADGRGAQENATALVKASELLKGIPAVRSLEVSCRIQPSSTVPAQLILTSIHEDMASLEAYAKNPVHLDFARLITAAAASRSCIDYEVLD